jgi:hypothetical protein
MSVRYREARRLMLHEREQVIALKPALASSPDTKTR